MFGFAIGVIVTLLASIYWLENDSVSSYATYIIFITVVAFLWSMYIDGDDDADED